MKRYFQKRRLKKMPKKNDNKETKVKKAEIDIPIFQNPNNTPELHITPEELQNILQYFSVTN